MKEFVLEFPSGLRCRYRTKGKPVAGQEHRPTIVWEGGDPGPDQFQEYKEWIHQVTQSLSNEWGVPLMHVFMLSSSKHEAWGYSPNGQPIPVAST